MSPPGHWDLVAPDFAARDTIWKSPLPFALWPVLDRPVVAYWLDEAVRREIQSVTIYSTDRPHLLRNWIDIGNYWSRDLRIDSSATPPVNAPVMDRLPWSPEKLPPEGADELLQRWFALWGEALGQRRGNQLEIDREISPGVWLGPGASVDPAAALTAPVWIGAHARVAANCRIGPHGYVAAHSVIDEDVTVTNAAVLEGTYIGRHTELRDCAAQGGLLINWKLGVAVKIVEDFIISSITEPKTAVPLADRILAALLLFPCQLLAKVFSKNTPASRSIASLPSGKIIPLPLYAKGPLILRRAGWLPHVVAGRLALTGILPRSEEQWKALPSDTRHLLEKVTPGLFALSDLYDCHDPSEPDEWLHASYQAGSPDGAGNRQARKHRIDIAMKSPLQ